MTIRALIHKIRFDLLIQWDQSGLPSLQKIFHKSSLSAVQCHFEPTTNWFRIAKCEDLAAQWKRADNKSLKEMNINWIYYGEDVRKLQLLLSYCQIINSIIHSYSRGMLLEKFPIRFPRTCRSGDVSKYWQMLNILGENAAEAAHMAKDMGWKGLNALKTTTSV